MINEIEFTKLILNLKQQGKLHHITSDSRHAQKDSLFFAIKGPSFNGNDFIVEASTKGAVCFSDDQAKQPQYLVWNSRKALAIAAGILYSARPKYLVGITGTNGKTSTVNYFMQIAHFAGVKSAAIGTVGVTSLDPEIAEFFDKDEYKSLTSPDSVSFFKILHQLAEFGVTHVAFEMSSHGLDQDRAYGAELDAAIFTSFSRDHLDYHGDMDNYLKAKLKIAELLKKKNGFLILPKNIAQYDKIKNSLENQRIFQILENENFKILSAEISRQIVISLERNSEEYHHPEFTFETKIIGKYQIYNLFCAFFSAIFCNLTYEKARDSLPYIKSVNGRLEKVDSDHCNIFIDYAHTPDAIDNALRELKSLKSGNAKLIIVFGCGGNRDSGKRMEMGRIASKLADLVIVTDDNPRNEDPALIRQEILSGIENNNFFEVPNREEAIKYSIDLSNKEDIILIAGKGHENYQIINGQKFDFDDKKIAKNYEKTLR
jgi:UDP-N-acetylmuramoyl-L-alanyl-D-glutamate--2,6-diaminopimelate ligase